MEIELCEICGAKLNEGAEFCTNCGTKTGESEKRPRMQTTPNLSRLVPHRTLTLLWDGLGKMASGTSPYHTT